MNYETNDISVNIWVSKIYFAYKFLSSFINVGGIEDVIRMTYIFKPLLVMKLTAFGLNFFIDPWRPFLVML